MLGRREDWVERGKARDRKPSREPDLVGRPADDCPWCGQKRQDCPCAKPYDFWDDIEGRGDDAPDCVELDFYVGDSEEDPEYDYYGDPCDESNGFIPYDGWWKEDQ